MVKRFLISFILVLCLSFPAFGMHAFGLIQTDGGGIPKIDTALYPYHGHIFIGQIAGWGAYLISGTSAQLSAINALPQAIGLATLTTTAEGVKWKELDSTVSLAVRTKLNTWLTARGYPMIPEGWTNRQVVLAVCKKLNPVFDIEKEWVTE